MTCTATKFDRLAAREPRLWALLLEARLTAVRHANDPEYDVNAAWYGYGGRPGFKGRMVDLVGWFRRGEPDEVLMTRAAYDVAYHGLYEALVPTGGLG